MEAVNLATSYYIAAIAIALTFRAGLFNIGVEGQLRLGSLFAAYFGAMIALPPVLHIAAIFFIAMFVTPPDALSMIMLAVPMWLLFEIGLFFGKLLEKRKTASH